MGIYERIEPDGRANLNEAEAASDVSAGRQEPGSRRGSMGDDALLFRNCIFYIRGQREPALRSVNLTLRRGEFLVLCGPSGCGKTTLLRLLKRPCAPWGPDRADILGGEASGGAGSPGGGRCYRICAAIPGKPDRYGYGLA